MQKANNGMPLGQVLIAEGLITLEILEEALAEQRRCGCRLGQVLTGQGRINNLKLYRALARHYDLPFADLKQEPPLPSLLSGDERHDYIKRGAIPWKKNGKNLIVAVTDKEAAKHWVFERFGTQVEFVITSPWDIFWVVQQAFATEDDADARERLWQSLPQASAKTLLAGIRRSSVLFSLLVLATIITAIPHGLIACFIAINLFYAATLIFKSLLFLTGGIARETPEQAGSIPERDLPVYTILVPLFQEEAILSQLVSAIRALDYPKSKLDVKLIVEEGDAGTHEAIKALRCERYFDIIPVPYSLPQTKPKACNYALRFAKGEYVTIYDAEDIPDPKQLKKVAAIFASASANTACVQAKLNYYNRRKNLLTHLFSLEYGIWFEYLLKGLGLLRMPIPLGGTSNHVRRDVLEQLHAWDPYNVTEDADLGVRLAICGFETRLVDSMTMEEAPVRPWPWLKQRSRWIKGYMQTYLVHMRNPAVLRSQLGMRGFIGFQLFIGAPCLIFLVSPVIWILWGLWWFQYIHISLASMLWLEWLMKFNLIFGFLLQMGLALVIAIRQRWWFTVPCCLVFPFYWGLHSLASFRALWQLFTRPFYWDKTEHGIGKGDT